MTNPKMDQLQAAVQNADDGDFLRELIGFAAQRLMDLEVEAFTGASYGEVTGAAAARFRAGIDRITCAGRDAVAFARVSAAAPRRPASSTAAGPAGQRSSPRRR
jgi:hypothetical protein